MDELLEARYRSADLGNLDDPLAETIYILLSRQTREQVYRPLFLALRERYPRWIDIRYARLRDLERALRPGGFQRQRAKQLKHLLIKVHQSNKERGTGPYGKPAGDLTLDFLHKLDDDDAEAYLKSLPGIGPKSARCILSYALDRSKFAVDTHAHRLFTRLELAPSNGRKADHDPFQEVVPESMRHRLHVNLVHHGRAVCHTSKPRCEDCILVSFCRRGQAMVSKPNGRPAAVDLFAGAGGLGRGFRQGGFRIALAIEQDRHAAQTYRLNNAGVPVVEAKITRHTRAAWLRKFMPGRPKITALLAGPPCQGYSANGSRRPHARRNFLYRDVARLARQLKADLVVLENVPGVKRVNGRGFLHAIQRALERAGFTVNAHLLRASDYGVPQRRQRYFFVGQRGKSRPPLSPPDHSHRRAGAGDLERDLPRTPTVSELLAELPLHQAGVDAERSVDVLGREVLNHSTMAHSTRVVKKIATLRAGKEPVSYRRLDPIEAQTIIAGHRALPVHPEIHRTISVREAAAIQGFPTDYFFCGPRSWQPLQVANAVPPPLAEAVARHLRRIASES